MLLTDVQCKIDEVKKGTGDYIRIENQIQSTCIKGEPIIVDNIFAVSRPAEKAAFKSEIMDQRLLFHGSRISNYVGLLSRGVLMPKVVVAMGGKRRDGTRIVMFFQEDLTLYFSWSFGQRYLFW